MPICRAATILRLGRGCDYVECFVANADVVCQGMRMTRRGCVRIVQTCGARLGVSLLSAERGKAIGKSWNSYRRNVLYAYCLVHRRCDDNANVFAVSWMCFQWE
jgi:hypothetical protein